MTGALRSLLPAVALASALPVAHAAGSVPSPAPVEMTATTLADPAALARLERTGTVFFADGFEDPGSATLYFEIGGFKEGHAAWDRAAGVAHTGSGALRCTARANGGQSSGAGPNAWFGPAGYDRVDFRRYIKFAGDYDQGNLNHVGGWLEATAGTGKWDDMGTAGNRPRGDDWFNASFEPWCDWKRIPPPGAMFLYVYWMDMTRDPDGHWWGNMLQPPPERRIALDRNRWYCLEHMLKANTPGRADGEIAAWIDGRLYYHATGIRWRTADRVKIKRLSFGVYVHQAVRDNTVWYDDVALSTGYIGTGSAR